MSPPDTYAYRTAACSSAQFTSSIRTSPAPRSTRALFLAWTRCLSDCLCMHSSFLVRSRHSSFYGFVARPCDGNAAQPGKTSSVSASFDIRRKDDESSGSTSGALSTTILGNGRSTFFVSCDFFETSIPVPPTDSECRKPSKFVDSQATHCLSCPAFASHNSILGNSKKMLLFDHSCVLFSGSSTSCTLSLHFSHNHFHTTVGHVITHKWSLHFHSYTGVNPYDRSRLSSSNSSIRCCPPAPRPSTQAAHQLL